MIAVLFEAWPKPGQVPVYLDIAAELRPLVDRADGFLSIERFESLSEPGKILSISFWRDEAAVRQWRAQEEHRVAQVRGRAEVFRDHRLRVATVVRDYGMSRRDEAPADSRARHDQGGRR